MAGFQAITEEILQLGVEFDPSTGKNNVAYLLQNFDAYTVTVLGKTSSLCSVSFSVVRIRRTISSSFSYLEGGSVGSRAPKARAMREGGEAGRENGL